MQVGGDMGREIGEEVKKAADKKVGGDACGRHGDGQLVKGVVVEVVEKVIVEIVVECGGSHGGGHGGGWQKRMVDKVVENAEM